MRHVQVVTQDQPQPVLAGWQGHRRLGLTTTEMAHRIVRRQRLIENNFSLMIDQQMVVAGIRLLDTGRSNSHSTQAEFDHHLGANCRSICRFDEIEIGIRRGG